MKVIICSLGYYFNVLLSLPLIAIPRLSLVTIKLSIILLFLFTPCLMLGQTLHYWSFNDGENSELDPDNNLPTESQQTLVMVLFITTFYLTLLADHSLILNLILKKVKTLHPQGFPIMGNSLIFSLV